MFEALSIRAVPRICLVVVLFLFLYLCMHYGSNLCSGWSGEQRGYGRAVVNNSLYISCWQTPIPSYNMLFIPPRLPPF